MASRIQIAKKDILALFDRQETSVYTHKQLGEILSKNRAFWRLAQSTTIPRFIQFLEKHGKFERCILTSESYQDKTVYTYKNASDYAIAVNAFPNSYLSHGTAVFLHGLTDQIPTIIYVNREQSLKKRKASTLAQHAIDNAFRREPRASRYIFQFNQSRICVISGKHTENLETGIIETPSGDFVPVTKLERTLIDIAVRPQYAGGVNHVLEAYKNAREHASSNVIIATLKKLDYLYPYHQVIGFYMARAEYPSFAIDILKNIGISVDFYLAASKAELDYDKEWRLFIPKGF